GALEEQLGEAEAGVPAAAVHVEDDGVAGVADLQGLPVLSVQGDVEAEVVVGLVVLDVDAGDLEVLGAGGDGGEREGGAGEHNGGAPHGVPPWMLKGCRPVGGGRERRSFAARRILPSGPLSWA